MLDWGYLFVIFWEKIPEISFMKYWLRWFFVVWYDGVFYFFSVDRRKESFLDLQQVWYIRIFEMILEFLKVKHD